MVFEEKYIGGLAKINYRSMSTINFGGLSIKLFIGVSPLYVSEGCPQINYRSMSTIYIGGLSTNKSNIFVLELIFIHGTNMCERVGEDSRREIGHVDIQVDMCMLHLDVCLIVRPLHVHLGGE